MANLPAKALLLLNFWTTSMHCAPSDNWTTTLVPLVSHSDHTSWFRYVLSLDRWAIRSQSSILKELSWRYRATKVVLCLFAKSRVCHIALMLCLETGIQDLQCIPSSALCHLILPPKWRQDKTNLWSAQSWIAGTERRPIIEFSVENAQTLKARAQREARQKSRSGWLSSHSSYRGLARLAWDLLKTAWALKACWMINAYTWAWEQRTLTCMRVTFLASKIERTIWRSFSYARRRTRQARASGSDCQ